MLWQARLMLSLVLVLLPLVLVLLENSAAAAAAVGDDDRPLEPRRAIRINGTADAARGALHSDLYGGPITPSRGCRRAVPPCIQALDKLCGHVKKDDEDQCERCVGTPVNGLASACLTSHICSRVLQHLF